MTCSNSYGRGGGGGGGRKNRSDAVAVAAMVQTTSHQLQQPTMFDIGSLVGLLRSWTANDGARILMHVDHAQLHMQQQSRRSVLTANRISRNATEEDGHWFFTSFAVPFAAHSESEAFYFADAKAFRLQWIDRMRYAQTISRHDNYNDK